MENPVDNMSTKWFMDPQERPLVSIFHRYVKDLSGGEITEAAQKHESALGRLSLD
jgi:hypothetical protein